MKKYITLFAFFLLVKLSSAQYSLVFCEDITGDGKPVKVSNQFQVDKEGGALKLLMRTDDSFKAENLDFRIYYMSDAGAEEEIIRLPQPVEPDWTFAWKELVLFNSGLYRIKVYTDKGIYLTSANVTIKNT